nr:MAG TPA: hypothetical protein [Caudoviricetes sp.]
MFSEQFHCNTAPEGLSIIITHIYEAQRRREIEAERTPAKSRAYAGGSCKGTEREPVCGTPVGDRENTHCTETSRKSGKTVRGDGSRAFYRR